MKRIRIFGINLNEELKKEGDEFHESKEIFIKCDQIISTPIFEIKSEANRLTISSSIINYDERTISFTEVIKKICANNETCFILLNNGSLHTFNFISCELKEFVEFDEKFSDISSTHNSLFAITKDNHLCQVEENELKIVHEFPKHQKIKKIESGAEHTLLLTSNSDLFSFGCGLRGCLGHGDVNNCEIPKQCEALAGLKIVDIAAGLFDSVAISSFGDVYSWGWNTHGQLGRRKVAQHTFEKASESHQQVYTEPQLIELEEDEAVKNVYCGSKHTILRTDRNRLFAAGQNNFGQLGFRHNDEDVDNFTEMPVKDVFDDTKVATGFWSTYLMDEEKS